MCATTGNCALVGTVFRRASQLWLQPHRRCLITGHGLDVKMDGMRHRFYCENNKRKLHFWFQGAWLWSEESGLAERSANFELKRGVEPRTCGFLEASAAHQVVLDFTQTSPSLNQSGLTYADFNSAMRTNVWIYQILVCVVVTTMDTGKTRSCVSRRNVYFA